MARVVALLPLLAGGACVASPANDVEVTGHACVVFDLRVPDECGAMQVVGGLTVAEASSQRETTTDDDGQFVLALPTDATSAVLEIAADSADRRTSVVSVPVLPASDVLTPVITKTLWATYLTSLGVADDPSTATIHVSFKRPGEFVGNAEVTGATQLLFNQGAAFDWQPFPPFDQTVDFMAFGIPAGSSTVRVTILSRADAPIYDDDVPVQAGAITWLHVGP